MLIIMIIAAFKLKNSNQSKEKSMCDVKENDQWKTPTPVCPITGFVNTVHWFYDSQPQGPLVYIYH